MKATVEELLARINILDIISQYVKLRKAGKNFVGLCPFHKEKTGSFTVSVDKQIYYCFGCHEGGNAINFLMKYENLPFQDVLENLGRQYGIEIARRAGTGRTGTLEALTKLAEHYHQNLKASGAARNYLERRGIGGRAIETFKIGFSDRTRQGLRHFLKASGVPSDIFLSTGIVRLKDGEAYDIFRGRIVIPILDVNSRVIGFGGRSTDAGGIPKYINSPESAVFSKRSALFGIDKARKHISEQNEAIIVEGYFDLIALYQGGIGNVVSTLGTSVTEGQLLRLRNYTENITLMLDGDEAGIKSALKLIGLLSDMDVNGNMIVLPAGHDPDSFIRTEGAEAARKVMEAKRPILDYFFHFAKEKHGVEDLEGKLAFIRTIMPHVDAIKDGIKKRLYVKRLSELTGLEEQYLGEGAYEENTNRSLERISSTSIIGKRLIGVLINNPGLIRLCREKNVLRYVREDDIREALSKIFDYFEKNDRPVPQHLVDLFDKEDLRELVLSATLSEERYDDPEDEKFLRDYFRYVERNFVKEESQRITARLKEAEKRGDQEEMTALLRRKRELLDLFKPLMAEWGSDA